MVRPIGTEFWSDWVKWEISTDPREHRLLYRVVDIVKVNKFGVFGDLIDAEEIKAVKEETRLPIF